MTESTYFIIDLGKVQTHTPQNTSKQILRKNIYLVLVKTRGEIKRNVQINDKY